MDTGYSGKPLAAKLGLQAGMRAMFWGAPDGYVDQFADLRLDLVDHFGPPPRDFIQIFSANTNMLDVRLQFCRGGITRAGIIWASWPKQSAAKKLGYVPQITEDQIRAAALPLGLVDVKVCAVDEIWSGLKLVLRQELR